MNYMGGGVIEGLLLLTNPAEELCGIPTTTSSAANQPNYLFVCVSWWMTEIRNRNR